MQANNLTRRQFMQKMQQAGLAPRNPFVAPQTVPKRRLRAYLPSTQKRLAAPRMSQKEDSDLEKKERHLPMTFEYKKVF